MKGSYMKRRKTVLCPACGITPLYWTEELICRQCENDLKRGKLLREELEKQDGEKVTCILGTGFLYDHYLPDELKDQHVLYSERFWNNSISHLILSITGQPVQRNWNPCSKNKSLAIYVSDGTDYIANVSKPQFEAIKYLADWIGAIKHDAYREGLKYGRNLLLNLANGSLSVEDFNDQSAKH
jgi:hypothetical protein